MFASYLSWIHSKWAVAEGQGFLWQPPSDQKFDTVKVAPGNGTHQQIVFKQAAMLQQVAEAVRMTYRAQFGSQGPANLDFERWSETWYVSPTLTFCVQRANGDDDSEGTGASYTATHPSIHAVAPMQSIVVGLTTIHDMHSWSCYMNLCAWCYKSCLERGMVC